MSKLFQYPSAPIYGPAASPRDQSGDSADYPYLGVYTQETTQRYMLGTRYITWDGRVFRYSLAGYLVSTDHGCWPGDYQAVAHWGEFGSSHAIGSNPIHMTTETTYDGLAFDGVFAEDVLAGGYCVLWPTGLGAMHYGIIGNDALAAAGTLVIYLDSPLAVTITADAGSGEALFSPYRNVLHSGSSPGQCNRTPCVVVPAVNAAASNYFWGQTWGICHVSSADGTALGALNCKDLRFAGDGSIVANDGDADEMLQYAGFQMSHDYNDGTQQMGAPFIMLQISI